MNSFPNMPKHKLFLSINILYYILSEKYIVKIINKHCVSM